MLSTVLTLPQQPALPLDPQPLPLQHEPGQDHQVLRKSSMAGMARHSPLTVFIMDQGAEFDVALQTMCQQRGILLLVCDL